MMRILFVVHHFPPTSQAGTEVYSRELALALRRRGHDVRVYFTEIHPRGRRFALRKRTVDGIPAYVVRRTESFRAFRERWMEPRMEVHFGNILEEFAPQVVHIQHLHMHSLGYVPLAKARGATVVYTLAEYLLMCPSNGWLLRTGGGLCSGPTVHDCARCAVPWMPELAARGRVGRHLDGLRGLASLLAPVDTSSPQQDRRALAEAMIRERMASVHACMQEVDAFIAPSRFLRRRFLEAGLLPAERVIQSGYGLAHPGPRARPRNRDRSGPLRIGFVGTIGPWKGAHVLIQALASLPPDRVRCEIWGDPGRFPAYTKRLMRLAGDSPVEFMGAFSPDRIFHVLARCDVLAVPSIWYENSPLTIHEASLAGCPVLAGDQGGMAELVRHEENGLLFRLGDPASLRAAVLRLIEEPGLLDRMRSALPRVKHIDEDAEGVERVYRHIEAGAELVPAPERATDLGRVMHRAVPHRPHPR